MTNKQKKICSVFTAAVFTSVCALTGSVFIQKQRGKDADSRKKKESIVTEAEDNETNLAQREALFKHLSLSMDDYIAVNSRCTDESLYQWWYKGSLDETAGIYIAVGDVEKAGTDGYAEFADSGIVPGEGDKYLLEIASGETGEDGFLKEDGEIRSYYFVQGNGDIEFVSMSEPD